MEVAVDKGLCIGCGLCPSIEPAVFRLDADGLAEAYSEATDANINEVKEAIESCPVGAISEV